MDKLLTSFPSAYRSLDIGRRTAYRWLADGAFPVPVHKVGRKLMVRTADLRDFVDGLGGTPVQTTEPLTTAPKRRGRPRKCAAQGGE